MQVAHFLEADNTPWAAPLCEQLFSSSQRWSEHQEAWQQLQQLPHDACVAALRQHVKYGSLPEMLGAAPPAWHPLVTATFAESHTFELTDDIAQQCFGTAPQLTGVQAVHMPDLSSLDTPDTRCKLFRALAALPNLASVNAALEKVDHHVCEHLACLIALHTGLTSLTFDAVHCDQLTVMAPQLHSLQQLSALSLHMFSLNGEDTRALCTAAAHLPSVTSLTLAGVRYEDDALDCDREVLDDLASLPLLLTRLCSLHLEFVRSPLALLGAVATARSLTHLTLDRSDDAGFKAAAEVGALPALAVLHLRAFHVEDGASGLVSMLGPLPALTELELRDVSLRSGWPAVLARVAAVPRLQSLQLSRVDLCDVAEHAIAAPQLQNMKLLQTLHYCINGWRIEDAGQLHAAAAATKAAVAHLTALTELYLDPGLVTDGARGTQQLLHVLPCTQLQRLRGWRAPLTGADLSAVANLPRLTRLELVDCFSWNTGDGALAAALPAMSGLRHLDLSHNQIGSAGTAAIARALPSFTALRRLDLRGLEDGAQHALPALVAAASQLAALTALNLSSIPANLLSACAAELAPLVLAASPRLALCLREKQPAAIFGQWTAVKCFAKAVAALAATAGRPAPRCALCGLVGCSDAEP